MKQNQRTSEDSSSKINPKMQSNPVTSPRKTSNRLYGGYNHSQRMHGFQGNADPFEILNEFCSETKNIKTVEDISSCLHNIAINKLGYNFTSTGLVNSQSNCLHIRLLDHTGNVYSSRILLSETQNPIIDSFINKISNNINNIDFINIPYLHNSPGIIIPLVSQDECLGVFIAGSKIKNQQNDEILSVLANYLALLIRNKQLSERFNQDINVDTLTGLKNHRDLQEKLSLEIKNAENKGQPVSIIMIDINNITQINREHGHAKGDEIICLVAEKVKQSIRNIDIAGRYGGDELAVILPETDNSAACYIAEHINHSISCCLIDDVGTVKVSIGVATYPTCSEDQEKLLILTEQAMFISKNKSYQSGATAIVSAQDIDFWNEMALDSFAAVIAKRHSQWGINYEDELVKKFHSESLSSNSHLIDVVTSLAGAIDAKDHYTRGHSQSVSRYAEALARTLNLPESEVEGIKLGAILHDVGKIGIPENILRKPGVLSQQEWDIMKQHPSIGAKKVLQPIQALKNLIPIVEHHHERWDGNGYPGNLKGEEIPFGARIVSIADAFHSLISDRPYRDALSIDRAVDILRVGAGIQWDRDLTRKFIIIAPSLCTMV
ncbi:MAG: diguanylate cyclase [Candidatus Gastranaerophilales bacterium]|nr:diguanylate cyclase [Candidatus Gastranaerophilales bacterium]